MPTSWLARAGVEADSRSYVLCAAAMHLALSSVLGARGGGHSDAAAAALGVRRSSLSAPVRQGEAAGRAPSELEAWVLALVRWLGGLAWAGALALVCARPSFSRPSRQTPASMPGAPAVVGDADAAARTAAEGLRASAAPPRARQCRRRAGGGGLARLQGDTAHAVAQALLRGVSWCGVSSSTVL